MHFPTSRRTFLEGLGLAATGAMLPAGAFAQAAPELTKLVVGFAAGGMTDTLGRRIADKLRGPYSANVIVENRTGAGGQIAIQSMKQSPADGSVMLLSPAGQLTIFPHIYKKLAYDPLADLEPVSTTTVVEAGLAVGPMVPASVTNTTEFLAWCRANPQNAAFGSPGAGTVAHFVGELLSRAGKSELRHVPYRGAQPAIQEMLGGQLAAVSTAVGDYLPFVASGRCRVLGTSGPKRNRFTPQVPSFQEQGFKDVVITEWFGLFVPARTPAAVIERAHQAVASALASPDLVNGMAQFGLEPVSSTPAELKRRMKAELEYWGPVIKNIGFTAE